MNESSPERRGKRRVILSLMDWAAMGFFHGVGVILLAVLLAMPVMAWSSVTALGGAFQEGLFAPEWWRLGLHLGLAACAWALLVILYHLFQQRRRAPRRVFKAAQGVVMIETLIVLVPFLLLTSGLSQLAMNNIASVMAHYAAFQGARTVWLWEPEARAGRWGASTADVNRRAQMAAALALAPTAPGSYSVAGGVPEELALLRGTMTATFLDTPFLTGTMGKPVADFATMLPASQGNDENLSFDGAFDSHSFPIRAARKLTFAYLSLNGNFTVIRGNTVGVRFNYHMHQAFPWFGYIFGQYRVVGGRVGHYTTLSREYTLPAQVDM